MGLSVFRVVQGPETACGKYEFRAVRISVLGGESRPERWSMSDGESQWREAFLHCPDRFSGPRLRDRGISIMRTTSRARALTVACSMAATVAVLTSPANAAAAEPDRHAIGPGPGLQMYSNDEYVEIFGTQHSLAEGVPLTGQPQETDGRIPPPDPSTPWHRVN